MAKIRKTRKEKVRSTTRQSTHATNVSQDTNTSVFTFNADMKSPSIAHGSSALTEQAFYLKQDLTRTGIVTTAIIVAELILFFTLSAH